MPSKKYLNEAGLTYFWEKIKSLVDDAYFDIKSYTDNKINRLNVVIDIAGNTAENADEEEYTSDDAYFLCRRYLQHGDDWYTSYTNSEMRDLLGSNADTEVHIRFEHPETYAVITMRLYSDLYTTNNTYYFIAPTEEGCYYASNSFSGTGIDSDANAYIDIYYRTYASASDWEQDDNTASDYIQNRPAIRAGTGENSVVEGNIEDDPDAATYTITITGKSNADDNAYTYTTEDTLPSSGMNSYGFLQVPITSSASYYYKINSCENGIIVMYIGLPTSTIGKTCTIHFKVKNYALGKFSHAEGKSLSVGTQSHAEGNNAVANGARAHAEGNGTLAHSASSHAEGVITNAIKAGAHSEGSYTIAGGSSSHSEGYYTITEGDYSHSEGYGTLAKGQASHAENLLSTSAGYFSHSEGGYVHYLCHIQGEAGATTYTITSDRKPPMFTTSGYSQLRIDTRSGSQSSFNASNMLTPVSITIANDHVTTFTLERTLDAENAIDRDNVIYLGSFTGGDGSHAEGVSGFASGTGSHAEGNQTYATNSGSHSEGLATVAFGQNQHVQGKFNIGDGSNTYAHIVGNGTSDSARSNAHTLDWSGNGWYAGKLTVGSAPTANMDVATKVYVDTAIGSIQRATAEEINEMCLVLGMYTEIITTNDYTAEEEV